MVPEESEKPNTVLSLYESINLQENSFSSKEQSLYRVSTAQAKSLKASLSTMESSIQSLKLKVLGETVEAINSEFLTPLNTSCSEGLEHSNGYAVNRFVWPVDPSLICLNCRRVVANPKECKDCQGLICSKCLVNLDFCPKGCPISSFRKPLNLIFSFLNDLEIRCSFINEGCQTTSTLKLLESHEANCEFRQIKCANPMCDKILSFYELEESSYCSDLCSLVGRFKDTLKSGQRTLTLQEMKKYILQAPKLLYDEARREKNQEYSELEKVINKLK